MCPQNKTISTSSFSNKRIKEFPSKPIPTTTSPFNKDENITSLFNKDENKASPFNKGGLRGIFFYAQGRLGKIYQLFEADMEGLIEELNGELVD